MKRIICVILMFLLLTPAAFAAEQKMTFRMESVRGNVGDTVTVTGEVVNAPVCASFRVVLLYDSTVLEPVSASKVDCKGLFMSNVNYKYQNKPAVNVLAADANKIFEGNTKLFTVKFKIIADTPENYGTPIEVVHQEFFDPSVPKPQPVTPVIEPCRIFVGDDQTEPPKTEENKPEGDTAPEGDTSGGATAPEGDTSGSATAPEGDTSGGATAPEGDTSGGATAPEGDTSGGATAPEGDPSGGATAPEGDTSGGTSAPEGDTAPETQTKPEDSTDSTVPDKKPTGSWIVDPETDDYYHVDEQGNSIVFQPDYTEKPAPGTVTDVTLTDKETGEEAGSIKVEVQENGQIEVLEQDIPSLEKEEAETDGEKTKAGFPVWGWFIIGGVVVLAGAAAAWYFLIFREK